MNGLTNSISTQTVFLSLILEVIFLGFAAIFIGYGFSEMKQRGQVIRNGFWILMGLSMALLSLVITYVFLRDAF